MTKRTFTYFAYGSNMLSARLLARCPSAKPLDVARLDGYQLRWHKVSTDGSGKCNIAPDSGEGAHVLGMIYEISSSDKAALDKAEGVGKGYEEESISVAIGECKYQAIAYLATFTDDTLRPYAWYHAFVLAGAREFDFPDYYLEQIKKTEVRSDPSRERHDKNMAIIPEAFQ